MVKSVRTILVGSGALLLVAGMALPVAAFATTPAAHPVMKMKAHTKMMGSPWVKSIQAALNKKENAHLMVDGFMGKQTKAALKKFQMAHKLKATGTPNKATDKALGLK